MVVPQLRRGENSLLLWNLSSHTAPVHTFIGHSDVVLEFDWRPQHSDNSDYQLVTWSKDQTLRVWRIDTYLQVIMKVPVNQTVNQSVNQMVNQIVNETVNQTSSRNFVDTNQIN